MPSIDKVSTPAYEAFAADILAHRAEVTAGKLFGMPCLKAGGKAFAGSYAGGVAFKLPAGAREQAAGLAGSAAFDPSGRGRPMKEWVVVAAEQEDAWDDLADAAIAFVLT